jgi:DNA-binding NtrC family response regulator
MTAIPIAQIPDQTHGIIGTSLAIRRALSLAERFAAGAVPILLLGATGTGKEMFASAIHRWSGRRGRLIDINCGGLPRDLVEGELFGHARGAFTGATADRPGLLSAAASGTLFLDELTSLPLETQVKLLRALETGRIRRLGESVDRTVDFRLVAAAQPDLDAKLRSGSFRLDLFHRVAGVVITLPALNERRDDVVILARHFAAMHGRTLEHRAERSLIEYSWPGNVRELGNTIERACLLSADACLERHILEEAITLGLVCGQENRDAGQETLKGWCSLYDWQSGPIRSGCRRFACNLIPNAEGQRDFVEE